MTQRCDFLTFPSSAQEEPARQSLQGALKVSPVVVDLLRRTAQALASSPGGLRFVPGSRPWLDNVQA